MKVIPLFNFCLVSYVIAPDGGNDPYSPTSLRMVGKFYRSQYWRDLRLKIIDLHGGYCMWPGCHRCIQNGDVIQCDHIKSIHHYWHLRDDPDNLQLLCGEIHNRLKGTLSIDLRPVANDNQPRRVRRKLVA